MFHSGREFAAGSGSCRDRTPPAQARWGISKRGDGYLRRLLVSGAPAVLLRRSITAQADPWLISLLCRKPRLVAAVAVANKNGPRGWPS